MTMVTMSPNSSTPDDDDDVGDYDYDSVDGPDDDYDSVDGHDDNDGEHSNMSKSAHYCSASFSKTGPSCRPALGYTTHSTFC